MRFLTHLPLLAGVSSALVPTAITNQGPKQIPGAYIYEFHDSSVSYPPMAE